MSEKSLEGLIAYRMVVNGRALDKPYYGTKEELDALRAKHGANSIRVIGPYKKTEVTVTRSEKFQPPASIKELVERRSRRKRNTGEEPEQA